MSVKKVFKLTAVFLLITNLANAQSAFIVFNSKTANNINSKADLFLSGGLGGVKPFNAIRLKYERENDKIYRGVLIDTIKTAFVSKYDTIDLLNGIYAEYDYDEAIGINDLYVFKELLNFFDILSARMANRWEGWIDKGVSVGAKIDLSIGRATTELSYDTDFETLHLFSILYRVKFETEKGYCEPSYKYRSEPKCFEGGVEIGIRL